VEAKFGIGMPSCKKEECIKDVFLMLFVLFRKESFKDRDNALQD